jgi:hypothetical protein
MPWNESIGDVIGKCVNHVVGTGRKACVRYIPLLFWWAHQDLNLLLGVQIETNQPIQSQPITLLLAPTLNL